MMKEFYQTYKAKYGEFKGQPVIHVCTITDGRSCARGVTVLGATDAPDETEGKIKAKWYALRAFKGREERRISDERALRRILSTDCPFTYHMEKNPELTFQERKRLFGKDWLRWTPSVEWSIKCNIPHPVKTFSTLEVEIDPAYSKVYRKLLNKKDG